MPDSAMLLTLDTIRTIIEAQEVIHMRRIVASMKDYIDECPTAPRPPVGGINIPLKLLQPELKKLEKLDHLRARYVQRVHVDPADARFLANLCRDNAEMLETEVMARKSA